tara:strand:- start:379 stop:480 length:102 start_codon:yes stop_codon:yes gene_type:complete
MFLPLKSLFKQVAEAVQIQLPKLALEAVAEALL